MTAAIRLRDGDVHDPRDLDCTMAVMDGAFDPAFGEAWTRGQCLAMLGMPGVWLSLAEGEGAGDPLGFALSRATLEDAELLLLAVLPRARGHGIGSALIATAATAAAARGATRLLLEARASNPALALYGRAGFAEIGRRPGYYRGAGGAVHDAVTLARALPQNAQAHYARAMIPPDCMR